MDPNQLCRPHLGHSCDQTHLICAIPFISDEHPDIIKALIAKPSFNPNIFAAYGNSALITAINYDKSAIAKLILALDKTDPCLKDTRVEHALTPLEWCAIKKNTELMRTIRAHPRFRSESAS